MEARSLRAEHISAAMLGLLAAASAVSLAIVSDRGTEASKYALVWVGVLGFVVLLGLSCLRPLVVVVVALMFLTCPLQLILGLPQSALVSAFLLGGAVLGFALRFPLWPMVPDPLLTPIGLFAGYGIVCAVYGLWMGNGIAYTIGDCFQVIEFAVVYSLLSRLLTNPRTVSLVLRFCLASVLATILVELTLFALGPAAGNLLPSWEPTADSDVVLRTIDINAAILFAVLFNFYPLAHSRSRRFWIRLAFVPTFAAIALSLSRGLWLCSLASVVVSVMLQGRAGRNRLIKAFGAVSIALLLLAAAWKTGSGSDASLLGVFGDRVFYGVDQVEQGLAGVESMETRRFLEWVIVGPQVIERPLLGHGLGATYVIPGFAVIDPGTNSPIDHHFIHNLYLVTAFRMGAVGLALLFWTLVRYLRTTLSQYKRMVNSWEKAMVSGLLAAVIGQLFLSLTQPTVIDHPSCAVIACALAVSSRLARRGAAGSMAIRAMTRPGEASAL